MPIESTRDCPSCGTRNRVPPRHLPDRGRCGKCGATLSPLARPIDVDEPAFDAIVGSVRVPVLVDFWAAWCAPCRAAAPEVARAASEMAGRAIVLKVDTEHEPALAARFGVRGIPNFLVLRDGRVVFQQAGLVDSRRLTDWLERARAAG